MFVSLSFKLIAFVCFCRADDLSYNFDQLVQILDKTVSCLENKYPNLSADATYGLGYGLGQMPYMLYTVPNMQIRQQEVIRMFESRMNTFLVTGLLNYPDDVVAQTLWYPQYWCFTGDADFRFKRGRIPDNLEPLNQTLSEIYERSYYTPDGVSCYTGFVVTNGKSATPRQCQIPCTETTYSTNYEVGFSSELRWIMVGAEFLLNCTNHSPEFDFDRWTDICTYEKRQVNALYEMRDEMSPELRIRFLNKIMQCGVVGYPEFLTEELITYIVGTIGCDGCVGTGKYSDENIQVLTAYTLSILSEAIRLIEEEQNGIPVVN